MYAAWNKPAGVYELTLKHNKKELEPRYFHEREKSEFDKSDLAEWRQWILHSAGEGAGDPEVQHHHIAYALRAGE